MTEKMKYLFFVLAALAVCSCGNSPEGISGGVSNPVIENILERKSVRNYIPGKMINSDTLEMILRAGMAAPSGMNRQPWNFIVVTGEENISRLADSLTNLKMLRNASAAIVVAGNPDLSQLWSLDCSAAAQNILLAAESYGLGAVWTAGYPYQDRMAAIKSALGIPDPWLPLCLIPVGYPAGENEPKDKWNPDRIHYLLW